MNDHVSASRRCRMSLERVAAMGAVTGTAVPSAGHGFPARPRHVGALAGLLAAAAVLAAGCGGSGSSTAGTSSPKPLAQVLDAYWPEPKLAGGLVANGIPSGIDLNSTQFQAAARICQV